MATPLSIALERQRRPAEQTADDKSSVAPPTPLGQIVTGTLQQLPGPPPPPPPRRPLSEELIGGTADAIDLIWTGFLAPMLGTAAGAAKSVQGAVEGVFTGKTRKEVSTAAVAESQAVQRSFGQPARDLLTSFGLLPKGQEGYISEKVLGPVMQKRDELGEKLEKQTGGAILKEDVIQLTDALLGGIGVKGTQLTTKRYIDRQKAKYIAAELQKAARGDAAAAAERLIQDEAAAQPIRSAARAMAETQKEDFRSHFAGEPTVPPARYQRPDPELDALVARAGEGFRPEPPPPVPPQSDAFQYNALTDPPGGVRMSDIRREPWNPKPPRGSGDPTALDTSGMTTMQVGARRPDMTEGEQTTVARRPGPPDIALPAAVGAAGLAALAAMDDDEREMALAATGVGFLAKKPNLGKQLSQEVHARRVAEAEAAGQFKHAVGDEVYIPRLGRTATIKGRMVTNAGEARYYYEYAPHAEAGESGRGSVAAAEVDAGRPGPPDLTLPAIAAAGTGLGLLALAPDDREKELLAAAGGAGIVLSRGKRPMFQNLFPDTTPLRSILEQDSYTFSTLEKLNPNAHTFKVQQIADLLKRQDVTAMERGVFEDAMKGLPADGTVTAKELMLRLRRATGDFELGVRKTDEYASYGLDAIGRGVVDSHGDGAFASVPATTRIYRSPLDLGTGNHFDDPNYFAHTRSFEEGGIRHVVEVQSDAAQHIKPLTPEARAEMQALRGRRHEEARIYAKYLDEPNLELNPRQFGERVTALLQDLEARGGEAISDFRNELARRWRAIHPYLDLEDALKKLQAGDMLVAKRLGESIYRARQAWQLEIDELGAKLDSRSTEAIQPMLKHWPRRIIREEIADAVRERAARIATLEAEPNGGPYQRPTVEVQAELQALRNTPPKIRFADADTVAKVEGWPVRTQFREGATAFSPLDEGVVIKGTQVGSHHDWRSTGRFKVENGQIWEELQPIALDGKPFSTPSWKVHQAFLDPQVAKELGETQGFSPQHQSIYDRYAGDITKFLKQLGAKHIEDAQGHGWWEIDLTPENKQLASGGVVQGRPGSARLQMGAADPDVLGAIALFGGGAAFGSAMAQEDEKLRGAIGGALTGLALIAGMKVPAVASFAEKAGRQVVNTVGNVSRELRSMSEPLARRLTTHEWNFLRNSHDKLQAIVPFTNQVKALPRAVRQELDKAILTGTRADVYRALGAQSNPALMQELGKAMAIRTQLEVELALMGKVAGPANDFPRIVVDPDGLVKHLKQKGGPDLAKAIDQENQRALKQTGEGLSPFDISNFINRNLAQRGPHKALAPDELQPFYAPLVESLPLWIRAAQREVDRARFFGPDLVISKSTGVVDLHKSIQNVVNRELTAGRIDGLQMDRMRELLFARFGPGERVAGPLTRTYKQVVYTGLLANPVAAATQLTDIAVATAIHGFIPTLKGLQAIITRDPSRWTLADMGLINHLADEFVSVTKNTPRIGGVPIQGAKILDTALKWSGFSAIDEAGKLTQMNAAAQKFRRAAMTVQGQQRIRYRYGDYFGSDLPQLIADLQAGKKTSLVGELVFRELSDVQPISKLEMPAAYLQYPGARALWTLKSFMIKQINLALDRGWNEIRKGNYVEGIGFLLRYGMVLGAAGMTVDAIKDWMLRRPVKIEWGDIPENVFKTFGWSQYVVDQWRKGKQLEAIGNTALPPWKMFQEIMNADPKAMRYVPWVGRFWYDWFMGGAKDAAAREAEAARREERVRDSAFTREERDEQRQRRRERRWERAQ